MKLKFAVAIPLSVLFSLSGCDEISTISKNTVKCGDDTSLQLVKSLLEDSTQSRVKNIASNEGVLTDSAGLRASTSQINFSLEDIRTSETDPNSTKVFCVAALSTSLNSEMIDRANFVTDYYEQANLSEEAFQQDIDMDGNAIKYSLEYSIQPTDDGVNIYGQLQNGSELIDFIGTAVVNAIQKNSVQAMKAQQQKANVENAIAEKRAEEEDQALIAQAEANASREATNEIAAISAEQAKVKVTMEYKRSEFNELWKTASVETKESLSAGQKEWVEERDEICLDRAREADSERQEIVRMECITELLSDRYYQLKEYIDTYG